MIHEMRLSEKPFADIRRGEKVIESRLYDAKRRMIELGDTIVFNSTTDSQDQIRAEVIGLLRYGTFANLFADHDPHLFGGIDSHELLAQIKQFYSDEDETKYGVLGIRIRLIENI